MSRPFHTLCWLAAFVCFLVSTALPFDASGVNITDLEIGSDYFFVRGEVQGLSSNYENIVDTFVTTNLQGDWTWIDANRLGIGTNSMATLIVPQVLGGTNLPSRLFVKMLDRVSENGDMLDRDSDGSPNVYEIHNDTNPYVSDFANAPKIVVPDSCGYSVFTNALWSSPPYSIVEIRGEMYFDESIDLPGWPLLITGPTNGYAVIHSSADIGVFMVNRRQTDHTLVRNVYLTMDKKSSFQAGFWIGGNLPWTSDAAGAMFENVRLRMYNPGTWYYGWHMYGVTDTPVVINNCTISAMGATDVLPVYVYGDSQVVITNGLDLVNMPNASNAQDYSWSGYSLTNFYGSCDSDGDGINDHDEVLVYGTDPYLKDSDGDRIGDFEEILHNASPTNQNVYCFSQSITLTNDYVNNGSIKLAFYDTVASNRVSEICTVSNRIAEVDIHCLLNSSRIPALHMWSNSEDSFVVVPYAVMGHDNRTSIAPTLVRQVYDADNDGMLDSWELANGLSPQNANDALVDIDGDGLINLHEYWASTDPDTYDGTNTLLSLCACSVNNRLLGKSPDSSFCKFSAYTVNGTNFSLNAGFWARDVDTSCASMWNDATNDLWGGECSPWHQAGTAISKRHIITAWHYAIPVGTTVWFMGNDGVPCSRLVTGLRSIDGDICIQALDRDLPDNVRPAKFLPGNYSDYMHTAERIPVVTFDQEEKLIVSDSAPLVEYERRSEVIHALYPCDTNRVSFYENLVGGDSGNPRFLIMGRQLVLLSIMHYGGTGSGCFVTHYTNEIQQAMDSLIPGYYLENACLEDYVQLDR